jgi:hypothetical protein
MPQAKIKIDKENNTRMSKIAYLPDVFNAVQLDVIERAEQICQDYAAQGYSLTLRQLYYRFIATDAFPESRRNAAGTKNNQQNYKWLGDLVARARVAGRIDWRHIEDRTREASGGDAGWDSPGSAVGSISDWYSISKWDGQENYTEVWVEKEALIDVISRPASRWNVRHFACKGYVSVSAMHDAAQRLRREERAGKTTSVIHLGDHDPSGIDMTRDIQDRLATFRSTATVDRIALNMDQVTAMNPPPSPAKITDSRAADYIDTYGDDSWELDAIEPADLEGLAEEAILSRLDLDLWNARVEQEEAEKRILTALSTNWDEVQEFITANGMLDE